MQIEKIIEDWKAESEIDETRLMYELTRTPKLHSKYLDFFIFYKGKLAMAEKDYNLMAWQKRKYFHGQMEKEELSAKGWSQWQGLKPSGTELEQLLKYDKDMTEIKLRIDIYKAGVGAIEYIMRQIQSRDYTIKAAIEYQKFIAGA